MNLQNLFASRPNKLKVSVRKIFFSDEETDFYIFDAEDLSSKSYSKVKLKGYVFNPRIYTGAELEVEGEWESHPKYGSTFAINKSQPLFDSQESRARYLSGHLPSVTPYDALQIVKQFGQDVFTVLDDEPDLLKNVSSLTPDKVAAITREWREVRAYANVSKSLMSLGVPTSSIKKVFSELGDKTLDIIKDNPYSIALVPGLDFPLADKIALGQGFSPDSDFRIASILEYLLEFSSRNSGHLFLNRSGLVKALNSLPQKRNIESFGRVITDEDVQKALEERQQKKRVVVEGDRVYLQWNHHLEQSCAEMITSLKVQQDLGIDTHKFIEEYEHIYKLELSNEQKDAIHALNEHKVLLLTGGPGTGKSTVSKALVKIFHRAGKSVLLMSPTGIAAKRLSTVVGEKAGTIHRTLGYSVDETWLYNEKNHLPADAVLVDETSMLDQHLFYRLLSALKPSTILVLVGDPAQLPSVGAGNVLHELIRSGAVHRVHLKAIFRQDGASDIILNAHRINNGEDLVIGDPTDKNVDFRFIHHDAPEDIIYGIKQVVQRCYGNKSGSTFQVLSPTYKGELGVDNLNHEIKSLLNPLESQQEVNFNGKFFRENDRIMIVENHYKLNVFNGEIGKVHRIDKKKRILTVKIFDEPEDRMLDLSFKEAQRLLMLSYVVTQHRSQGNEWDYVVMPFHEKFTIQLQRNLLYTAVTRAKKKVFIFGQWKALRRAIANNEVAERNTYFAERLRMCLDGN
jgi:exodeoxyribonuclease V alpha subunit